MSLDCLGQTCLVPSLRLARRLQKSRTKRASKSPLTAVLQSWLLSSLHCRFLFMSVAHSLFISRWCRNDSGSFRRRRCVDWRGDWWAVEGASHSCYQEPGTVGWGAQYGVPEAVHSRGRSRELLEQAFDHGKTCAQMRNLLVLFHVGSKFLPHFFFCRSIRDRSRCHCDSCHWSSDGVLMSLRLWGGESTTDVSLDE